MANLFKRRGSSNYFCRFQHKGQDYVFTTGTVNRKEALEVLKRKQAEASRWPARAPKTSAATVQGLPAARRQGLHIHGETHLAVFRKKAHPSSTGVCPWSAIMVVSPASASQ